MQPLLQICRFLAVGALIFLLDTGLFLLLFHLGLHPLLANTAGMLLGFTVGLLAHHSYTFRHPDPLSSGLVLRYGGSFVFNLLLASLVLHLALTAALSPLLAKLLATTAAVISNFLISRYWVFTHDVDPN